MRHKYVNQEGLKDCAVACLYNIIRYYDGNISMDKLRKLLKTDDSGTSIYNVVEVSKSLGLKSCAYHCELNDLCNLNFPIIAHIKIENKYEHFVIIDSIVDDLIIVHDPIRGFITYDIDKFDSEWSNIIITFEKTQNIVNEKTDKYYKNIILYLKSNIKSIVCFIIFSLLLTIFSLLNSIYFRIMYDSKKNFIIFCIFSFICILDVITKYFRNNLVLKHNTKLDFEFTSKVYKKILSLPIKYHHNRPVGDIVSRINDLSSIKEFINVISFSLIIDIMNLLITGIILFNISKTVFILLLILISISLYIYLYFRGKLKTYSMINKECLSSSNSYLIEGILGIDTIKNCNISYDFLNNFKKKYKDLVNSNERLNSMILNVNLFQEFTEKFGNIFILFISFSLYKESVLSFSNLILINTLMVYFSNSFNNVLSLDNLYVESKNSYKRLNSLLLESNDDLKNNNFNFNKEIKVKKLNYHYDSNNLLLNDLSFNIKKGDYVFIKGKSGIGKSTIIKLLTKQLDTKDNKITLDGINIDKLSVKDISNNICYVSQNEYIFTDSILNNIRLFKRATKKEINKVMRITGVDNILREKDITINYLLEENGHNISGGERQRILLARSLLQNKKILILDETMNELDVDSERKIIKNIKTEYDVTLILISHRYNNLDLFNNVIKI